jgi:hypothetical protein
MPKLLATAGIDVAQMLPTINVKLYAFRVYSQRVPTLPAIPVAHNDSIRLSPCTTLALAVHQHFLLDILKITGT